MKVIELTRNQVTLVDEEDYDDLLKIGSWRTSGTSPLFYASTDIGYTVLMHRVILERKLGEPIPEGYVVDHINRDTLDNRRENLRLATKSQNGFNSGMRKNNTSGYKGVDFHTTRGQYRARLGATHLGWFSTMEEAMKARDLAEQEADLS